MRKIDVHLDDVKMYGHAVVAVHFSAPVEWKSRFAIGCDEGWVNGSELPRALNCFRATPKAKITGRASEVDGIADMFRSMVENAPDEDIIKDEGWGVSVSPHTFSMSRLETPVIGFNSSGIPVYPPADRSDFYSLEALGEIQAGTVMGSLRPKSSPARARFNKKLEAIWGGTNVLSALVNYPRSYRDLSNPKPSNTLVEGIEDVVIFSYGSKTLTSTLSGVSLLSVRGEIVESGDPFEVGIFGDYFDTLNSIRSCEKGDKIIAFGRVGDYKGRRTLKSPWMFPLDLYTAGLLPIYRGSSKSKVTPMMARRMTTAAINEFIPRITDPLPAWLVSQRKMMSRSEAFAGIHSPKDWVDKARSRKRLVYDEFIRLQAYLSHVKKSSESPTSKPVSPKAVEAMWEWTKTLPFPLTGDQRDVISDIVSDMSSKTTMRRLLMGDVGTGKTVCALTAAMLMRSSHQQVAVLAPTSVLAQQLAADFESLPLRVETVLGGVSTKKNRNAIERIGNGEVDVVVGTHSILSDSVKWKDLGLVIVDEQHKFGVDQRSKLLKEAKSAHFLMMSATPIPATVASVSYGDLDVSVIREMPSGRKPVKTTWLEMSGDSLIEDVNHPLWEAVKSQVMIGHKVYVVSSLVEESEERASVESTAKSLSKVFGEFVGVVHGKMKMRDKEEALKKFKSGETPILVASSVVEVGVNVPDATMEIVLDAPRFGLASLHQLRGRVGRGNLASSCVLVGEPSMTDPELSKKRMRTLVKFSSGFDVAEEDLKLRGEGEFFGSSQSGRSDLGIASLSTDSEILKQAQEDFERLDQEVIDILVDELISLHPNADDESEDKN